MKTLFRNTNFVLLFIGRLLGNIGDSLYYIAATWLTFNLGGSSFYSGLAGFLTLLPELLSFLVGPIVDRLYLKSVLIISCVVQGALVLFVPILYLLHQLTVSGVLIIMPLISLFNLFTFPAENVLIPQIVEDKLLVKANSAMSFAYQGTDLIFSSLAGILISVIGAVSIYFIDSMTFILSVILFMFLKLEKQKNKTSISLSERLSSYKSDLSEGIRFVSKPLILNIMIPILVVNFTFSAAMAVLPAFSRQLGGSSIYGILMTCYSGGFLIGTLLSSFISERLSIGKGIILGYGLSGIMWILAALLARYSIVFTFIFLILATFPIGATNIMFSSFFQIVSPKGLIGRVSAVNGSLINAAMPLGSLVGGTAAIWIGSNSIIGINGIVILFLGMYWCFTKSLRNLPKVNDLARIESMTVVHGN